MGKMSTRQVFAPAVKHQVQVTATYVFYDAGYYHAVDWGAAVLVNTSPDLATALQAAIDYVYNTGGGLVFILDYPITPYWHWLSRTVHLRYNVWVSGESIRSTDIRLRNNANCNMFEWSPTVPEYFTGLFNMYLNGNMGNNLTGHCLFTTYTGGGGVADLHCGNVWFVAAAEDGAHLEGPWGYKFTNCLFEGNRRDGLYMEGAQCSILGFYASLNGRDGIRVHNAGEDHWFVGQCRDNTEIGFNLAGSYCFGIINTRGNGHDGIRIQGFSWDYAEGNSFRIVSYQNSGGHAATYYNLRLYYARNNEISGVALGGASVASDIYAGGNHNWYWLRYATITYSPVGTEIHMQIVNGHATNPGDPDAVLPWSGETKEAGLVIRDTVNNLTYVYDSRVVGNRYTI